MAEQKPSLLTLFVPPEDYIGKCGLVCGYSASPSFLRTAMENFTNQDIQQRDGDGLFSLSLYLHDGSGYIKNIPGLVHHRYKPIKNKPRPFRLMHAKVALLLFEDNKPDSEKKQRCLRLIVSTGNWTRQTVEESLDLVWWIDLYVDRATGNSQDCLDMEKACDFFIYLATYYEIIKIDKKKHDDFNSKRPLSIISEVIKNLPPSNFTVVPRFIDSRHSGLLKKIIETLENPKSGHSQTHRNTLLMGSGFFEGSTEEKLPSVLVKIINDLTSAKHLSERLAPDYVQVAVNPKACQGIAAALSTLCETGWMVYPAYDPNPPQNSALKRNLHAKFIFSGKYSKESKLYNHSWLYLGSGNLTKPGLLMSAAKDKGNLEAGVVLNLKKISKKKLLNHLPFDPKSETVPLSPSTCEAGENNEIKFEETIAPPISILKFKRNTEKKYWLEGSLDDLDDFKSILNFKTVSGLKLKYLNDKEASKTGKVRLKWTGEIVPAYILMDWVSQSGKKRTDDILVLGEDGRLASNPLAPLTGNNILINLKCFPEPLYYDPKDEDDDNDDDNHKKNNNYGKGTSSPSQMPYQQWANIIEAIAEKQCLLNTKTKWEPLSRRIKLQLSRLEEGDSLRQVKINVLSPLLAEPFRPLFARHSSKDTKHYENFVRELMEMLQFTALPSLGE